MKVLFYSIKEFERPFLAEVNRHNLLVSETTRGLTRETAAMARGYDAICIFTGDDASASVLNLLFEYGIRFIATRAAGFDNIDIEHAESLGITVANVPEYSPSSIAEHAVALMLALDRKLLQSNHQVRQHDFRVDSLIGFDLAGKTVGIIGTGRIGSRLAQILHGFGCHLLGYDQVENKQLVKDFGMKYLSLSELCRGSDIISLHVSLNEKTRHLINEKMVCQMKRGVMLINTSRGACLDTAAVLSGLEGGLISYFGADVYEHEKGLFFYNWCGRVMEDQQLEKLLGMPNVIITPHQAFATQEALSNIADTTIESLSAWSFGKRSSQELTSSSCFMEATKMRTAFVNENSVQ